MGGQATSSAELQRLWAGAEGELHTQIRRAVRAIAEHLSDPGAEAKVAAAMDDLRRRVGQLMALADLLGRRRLMLELDRLRRPWPLPTAYEQVELTLSQFDLASTVPSVPFRDAIADLLKREPRLAGTAQQVAEIYAQHGFGAVHAADESILRRVQAEVNAAIETGTSTPKASEIVARLAGWTKAYSETVVRTNLTTAYAAGRFAQLRDPMARRVVPALRFVTVQEPYNPETGQGTRPNHAACHGLTAAIDDPIWEQLAPPLGYNCRCTVALQTVGMLESRGLLLPDGSVKRAERPRNGGPDKGFTHSGRPDRGIYGASA